MCRAGIQPNCGLLRTRLRRCHRRGSDHESKSYRNFSADYLVSCDGNRSATRKKENISWGGPGLLDKSISINFKADLTPYLGTRTKHGVTYVNNPNIEAGFCLESGGKEGFMIVTRAGRKKAFPPDSVTEKDAK